MNCVTEIQRFLTNENINYSFNGLAFAIKIPEKMIEFVKVNIQSIVNSFFNTMKKMTLSCKYNYFDNILYIQFKRCIY